MACAAWFGAETTTTIRGNSIETLHEAPLAVMVTAIGPAGPTGGVYDQTQRPVVLFLVTAPSEAVSVTVARSADRGSTRSATRLVTGAGWSFQVASLVTA